MACYSGAGFDRELVAAADSRGNVLLAGLARMYAD